MLALKRVSDELQHYYLFMIKGPLFDVQYTIKLRFRFEHYYLRPKFNKPDKSSDTQIFFLKVQRPKSALSAYLSIWSSYIF